MNNGAIYCFLERLARLIRLCGLGNVFWKGLFTGGLKKCHEVIYDMRLGKNENDCEVLCDRNFTDVVCSCFRCNLKFRFVEITHCAVTSNSHGTAYHRR